jgi:hypothetical protein
MAIACCYELRTLPGLGETLVTTRQIESGELVLSEEPLVTATQAHELPSALLEAYDDADDLDFVLADVCAAHTFSRAHDESRQRLLRDCCGAEACSDADHQIIRSARAAARWCAEHDVACAAIPKEDLERALVVFELNGFGQLADGRTNGATAIFPLGSKFSHRCLAPNCW